MNCIDLLTIIIMYYFIIDHLYKISSKLYEINIKLINIEEEFIYYFSHVQN